MRFFFANYQLGAITYGGHYARISTPVITSSIDRRDIARLVKKQLFHGFFDGMRRGSTRLVRIYANSRHGCDFRRKSIPRINTGIRRSQ